MLLAPFLRRWTYTRHHEQVCSEGTCRLWAQQKRQACMARHKPWACRVGRHLLEWVWVVHADIDARAFL